MPSPADDGVIKKLPRDWEAGTRMVCVSTERLLLVCAPCMHTHTCRQRMPHKLNYHSPTSFGVSRLVRVFAHIICASLLIIRGIWIYY
ncbi:hypothetical protein BAE44_0022526 [Dichanthelium oligosanthes]|uniref:Uncharacterized protein n=1 Tax=Dichanthelium oligosanthes TaxID=888268 RepID=A0A1E5UUG0_9POAL|nr:hypothetical protein BAE44_0022526 [Dichanthelium oligosanthes]